uniref:Response regulatory domain-containing protein n=1 Tax=mine drainage metagenome TaxID=410659 RepID=E6PZQ9_9ZZZZ
MTTEPTQPAVEAGPSPAELPQGHRRRRRRRKSKSSQAGQNTANPPQATTVAQPAAQPFQQAPPVQQQRPGGGQQQGGGRKKKRPKQQQQQASQPQPGNSIHGSNGYGGQGKRKASRQKGPRQFVGPMDHSYRIVNGNVADGPPSTIPFAGNGAGYYNEAPMRGQVAPVIADDAPTRIFFFLEDLFFLAKIQEVSRKLGVKVEFVKGEKEELARIAENAESERPSLLVFDLNNASVKPLTVIPKLKTKLKKSVSIIGFLSHLQGDLKMKAIEAGCDTVMPRSAFSQSLPNLLRRYGVDDEEDYYPQPV